MKIILSRKGFDSENGKMPSPMLGDGTLVSLPIPVKKDRLSYNDIFFRGKSYDDIIFELSGLGMSYRYAHLDPDIRFGAKKRQEDKKSWTAAFGQHGAAQTLLENCGVGDGDIFLFFGWFKQSEMTNGNLSYARKAADQHILFGYLQVGRMYSNTDIVKSNIPQRIQCHPHRLPHYTGNGNNCIYEASATLSTNNALPGFGVFKHDASLVLTEPGKSRSNWLLPVPEFANVKFCSHNVSFDGDGRFSCPPRGQEFVIDCDKYPNVKDWAIRLIESNYDDSE